MSDDKAMTDKLAEALKELTEACEAEYCSPDTDGEGDDEKVAFPEESCSITFGMIRRARAALAEHDAQPAQAAQPVGVPDGFFIGGPHATAIVHDRAHIEPVIAALCSATGDDADDYTATDLAAPQPPAQPPVRKSECAHVNTVRGGDGVRWCQHCREQLPEALENRGWGDPIPYPSMGDEPIAHVGERLQPSADAEDAARWRALRDSPDSEQRSLYYELARIDAFHWNKCVDKYIAARAAEGDGNA